MKKIIVIVVLVLVAILIFVNFKDEKNIPVVVEFPEKTVYTSDLSYPKEPLIQDCEEKGGTFDSCGSPCGPEEDFCTAVCAFTCEY